MLTRASLFGLFVVIVSVQLCIVVDGLTIPSVAYHRQINRYACGDASLQMLLRYRPPFSSAPPDQSFQLVSQQMIINVARTSHENGTMIDDLRRAAHFSRINDLPPMANFPFPTEVPTGGYPNMPLGRAAFVHRDAHCWAKHLPGVLAETGYPLILLMWYDENPADEAHFRLLIGYSERDGTFDFLDPWDRGLRERQPRRVSYTETELCRLWNHSETTGRAQDAPYLPYAALFAAPWRVDASYLTSAATNHTIFLTVTVTYPCPAPFCSAGDQPLPFSASKVTISLDLPPFIVPRAPQSPLQHVGSLDPGATVTRVWQLSIDDSHDTGAGQIRIQASGLVSGTTPDLPDVDGYSYIDAVGGSAVLQF